MQLTNNPYKYLEISLLNIQEHQFQNVYQVP